MSKFDFQSWTTRAKQFLRSLSTLPGHIMISDCIEPPATDNFRREWLDSADCSLPIEINEFISTASNRCCFFYEWRLPQHVVSSLPRELSGLTTLSGGADFCEAAKYYINDHRTWFQTFFPDRSPSLDELGNKQGWFTQNSFLPLATLESGEVLSLELIQEETAAGEVYLIGRNSDCRNPIATSFEQFLIDWETICYQTPTRNNLLPWLSASGQLKPDFQIAHKLRQLLTQNLRPIE